MEHSMVYNMLGIPMKWDKVSGYCVADLGYILKKIIPKSLVARAVKDVAVFNEGLFVGSNLVPAGSFFEGLQLPPCDTLPGTDIDIMMAMKDIQVIGEVRDNKVFNMYNKDLPQENTAIKVMVCHDGCPKGYVQIRDVNTQQYLPKSKAFQKTIHKSVTGTHGPAVMSARVPELINTTVTYEDQVDCIKTQCWPQDACKRWRNPKFKSSWPSREMRSSILNGCCHIVAVSHPLSSTSTTQWRISFSEAERRLSSCLSLKQRQAYLIFKVLHKQVAHFNSSLSSYFLKTVLYWSCEERTALWSKALLWSCVNSMIDRCIHYLSLLNFPNYFIPENNMIGHLSRETVKRELQQLVKLRRDPLRVLLQFIETHRFGHLPVVPLSAIMDDVIHMMQNERNGKAFVYKKNWFQSSDILMQILYGQEKSTFTNDQVHNTQMANMCLLICQNVDLLISLYRKAMSTNSNFSPWINLRLAALYAYKARVDRAWIQQLETMMEEIHSNFPRDAKVLLMHGMYLIYISQKYDYARDVLFECLHNSKNTFTSFTFSAFDCMTHDADLLVVLKTVAYSVDITSIVYYLLITISCLQDNRLKAEEIAVEFDHYLDDFISQTEYKGRSYLGFCYAVLECCYLKAGRKDKAKSAYERYAAAKHLPLDLPAEAVRNLLPKIISGEIFKDSS